MSILIFANLVVGASIGVSGIGGFFLPIVYSSILGIGVRDSLLLSFSAFLVSGFVGTFQYARLGYIRKHLVVWLAAGCLLGAVIGVKINYLLPTSFVKGLLYFVVLAAGISLLMKMEERNSANYILESKFFIFGLSLFTAILCSMSGAGGALILVPVLVALGEKTKYAVGMGILGSVFISIPSSIGYFAQSTLEDGLLLLVVSLAFHGLGVFLGSNMVEKIDQTLLRKSIAYLSIFSSLFLFVQLFSKFT